MMFERKTVRSKHGRQARRAAPTIRLGINKASLETEEKFNIGASSRTNTRSLTDSRPRWAGSTS